MRRLALPITILIIVVVAAVLALTHKSNSNTSNQPPASNNTSSQNTSTQSSGAVTIRDMMFTPSQITVAKGGTVTWTNDDSVTHTVVDDLSNVGGPSSGDIAPGQTYSFTFNKTGSFQYHCSIHPSMRGTIVVK